MLEVFFASVLLVILLVAFQRLYAARAPAAIWSPIYFFPASYAMLGIGGYVYYGFVFDNVDTSYSLDINLNQMSYGLSAFLMAIDAFFLGVLVYGISSKKPKHTNALKRRMGALMYRRNGQLTPRTSRVKPASLGLLLIPLLLTVVGIGPNEVISRNQYLIESYHYILVSGSLLSLPAIFYLGTSTLNGRTFAWRASCITIFLLYQLLYISMSTRQIVLLYIFYLAGLSLGGARRSTVILMSLIVFLSLPLLLIIPLGLRTMPIQGLAPLLDNLSLIITAANLSGLYFDAIHSAFLNLTFGVPLAGYIGSSESIPADSLIASLNPLPSFIPVPGILSWDSVRENLRVSLYVPYSALGELLNHGWHWLMMYYFLIGVVSAWLDTGARYFSGTRTRWGYIAGCALLMLFSFTSTQYNLRSSSRLIWYAIAIAYSWQLICRIKFRSKVLHKSAS